MAPKTNPKIHFYDLRLSNNVGILFPKCCANSKMLDLDKSHWEITKDYSKVTCQNCHNVYGMEP